MHLSCFAWRRKGPTGDDLTGSRELAPRGAHYRSMGRMQRFTSHLQVSLLSLKGKR